MLSHSTVRVGPGPSSRCSKTNCFKARTAVFSSICSSCGRQSQVQVTDSFSTLAWLTSVPSQNDTVRVYVDLDRHRGESDGILREGLEEGGECVLRYIVARPDQRWVPGHPGPQ